VVYLDPHRVCGRWKHGEAHETSLDATASESGDVEDWKSGGETDCGSDDEEGWRSGGATGCGTGGDPRKDHEMALRGGDDGGTDER
jgi:hypothetical protein